MAAQQDKLDDALCEAVRNNRLGDVKNLLEAGASNLDSAVIDAAFYGNADAIRMLIAHGMPAKSLDYALDWAVLGDQREVLKYLLEVGAGSDGYTSCTLAIAARWQLRDMCDDLIQHGACWKGALRHVASDFLADQDDFCAILDFSGVDPRDALYDAAENDDMAACRALVDKLGTASVSATAVAIRKMCDVDTIKYLVTNIRPEKNRKLKYLVKVAIGSDHVDALRMLLTDIYKKERLPEACKYASQVAETTGKSMDIQKIVDAIENMKL